MSNDVFANGREISCKKAEGKTICAFPDVCFTPPENPATPPGVPVPYPNTAFSKDTTSGSKTVKISEQEIMLKNKSFYKTSTGDEAGSAAKKGVISSKIKGKAYFTSWSMDVKVEGENVVRHMDLSTHNHASQIGNESIPWLYADSMSIAIPEECKTEQQDFKEKCGKHIKNVESGAEKESIELAPTNKAMCEDSGCKEARACVLMPKSVGCCDGKTGHHLVPNSLLQTKRGTANDPSNNVSGLTDYTEGSAPCCCVEGHTQNPVNGLHTEHSLLHKNTRIAFEEIMEDEPLTFDKAKKAAAEAHTKSIKDPQTGESQCNAECLETQLQVHFDRVSAQGQGTNKIEVRQKNGSTNKAYRKGL